MTAASEEVAVFSYLVAMPWKGLVKLLLWRVSWTVPECRVVRGGVGSAGCGQECGAGDLVPDGVAVGHLGAVATGGHPVAVGAEVR